jgi:predicted DNA-binding transcriptional regulator YafY
MRYERIEDLLKLAVAMQGNAEGVSLNDIAQGFEVSRRTAERMRDAVLRAFPQAEEAPDAGDGYKRWRIPAGTLNRLISVSAEELAELQQAAARLDRDGLAAQAAILSGLAGKVAAMVPPARRRAIDADMELLLQAEGLAMRPGPRARIADGVLESLREAILGSRRVLLHYYSGITGEDSRQPVEPYGILYGARPYLVAYNLNEQVRDFHLFRLSGLDRVEETGEHFERREDFSLRDYAARSFGIFQEEPVDVAWKFTPEVAPEATDYLFHPTQVLEEQPDGGLIVRFHAGGMREMAWHLYTWGDAVEVLEPGDFWERVEDS